MIIFNSRLAHLHRTSESGPLRLLHGLVQAVTLGVRHEGVRIRALHVTTRHQYDTPGKQGKGVGLRDGERMKVKSGLGLASGSGFGLNENMYGLHRCDRMALKPSTPTKSVH